MINITNTEELEKVVYERRSNTEHFCMNLCLLPSYHDAMECFNNLLSKDELSKTSNIIFSITTKVAEDENGNTNELSEHKDWVTYYFFYDEENGYSFYKRVMINGEGIVFRMTTKTNTLEEGFDRIKYMLQNYYEKGTITS